MTSENAHLLTAASLRLDCAQHPEKLQHQVSKKNHQGEKMRANREFRFMCAFQILFVCGGRVLAHAHS